MSSHDTDPEAILANYSRVKLQCRVDRHRWGRKVRYELEAPSIARRYMGCQDCGTERWRLINIRTFEPLTTWRYNYAHGYRTPASGLTLADFQERLYREDYGDAEKNGRVAHLEDAVDEPSTVTPITKKGTRAS